MKQLYHLKSYKLQLTALSPVFIGSDVKLSGLDYMYDYKIGKLRLIDEGKFYEFLSKRNLLDDFMKYVLSKGIGAKLSNWSRDAHIGLNRYDVFKRALSYSGSDLARHQDISLFVANCDGNHYIPGSSIKGAIRTALLFERINSDRGIKNRYGTRLREALQNGKGVSGVAKKIENELLCIGGAGAKHVEVADVARGIEVSDSSVISDDAFDLFKACDYSFGYGDHALPLYRECMKPNADAVFSITFDTRIARCLNIDIDYILKSLDNFTKNWRDITACIANDAKNNHLAVGCNIDDANFCIGGGAGFITKTLVYSMFSMDEAKNLVRLYLDRKFRSREFKKKDRAISPRTLKLAKIGAELFNIGWCNLSIAQG